MDPVPCSFLLAIETSLMAKLIPSETRLKSVDELTGHFFFKTIVQAVKQPGTATFHLSWLSETLAFELVSPQSEKACGEHCPIASCVYPSVQMLASESGKCTLKQWTRSPGLAWRERVPTVLENRYSARKWENGPQHLRA